MIFGISAPKFVYSGTDILLDYVTYEKSEPDYRYIELEEEIGTVGNRYSFRRGSHWDVELKMYLYQYEETAEAKYLEIMACEGLTGTFYLHRDKDPFKDSAGVVVPFLLREIIPSHFDSLDWHDLLTLKFESTRFVDRTKSTIATIVNADGFTPIINPDGQNIIG
jgi:hypothetical protein